MAFDDPDDDDDDFSLRGVLLSELEDSLSGLDLGEVDLGELAGQLASLAESHFGM